MQRDSRLKREMSKLQKCPASGISVNFKDDRMDTMEAQIIGPDDSPYQNVTFQLEIKIPENYPFAPPNIKFLTKIYHPNIDNEGRICLDLMKMPPAGHWRPTMGIEGLLIGVRMLMETPNPKDPLMADIAYEYQNDLPKFIENAKKHCEIK